MDTRTCEEVERELQWLVKQVHDANQHGKLRSIIDIREREGDTFRTDENALLILRQERLILQDWRRIWFDESLKDVLDSDWSWDEDGLQLQLPAKSKTWYLRFWAPEGLERLLQYTPPNWFESTWLGSLLGTLGLFAHMEKMNAANLAEARKWGTIFPFDPNHANAKS